MRHISLIEYTTEEVHYDCNSSDNSKDRSGADGLLRRLGSNAGGRGQNLEMVGALVRICANERRYRLGCKRVFIAVEGDQS
jgi:hypothetical protein